MKEPFEKYQNQNSKTTGNYSHTILQRWCHSLLGTKLCKERAWSYRIKKGNKVMIFTDVCFSFL